MRLAHMQTLTAIALQSTGIDFVLLQIWIKFLHLLHFNQWIWIDFNLVCRSNFYNVFNRFLWAAVWKAHLSCVCVTAVWDATVHLTKTPDWNRFFASQIWCVMKCSTFGPVLCVLLIECFEPTFSKKKTKAIQQIFQMKRIFATVLY